MRLTFELVSALISFWITIVILATFVHFFLIEVMRDRPRYLHWAFLRVFFGLLYIAPFQLLTFWEWALLVTFQLTSHFVIYNPGLNKLRDLKYVNMAWNGGVAAVRRFPFWYLGEDSGWLDKVLIKLGPVFYRCFYFGCLFVMLLSMVSIYIRYT